MAGSPFIVEVTQENFAEVMQASARVPVLMDFWASWCQPCHTLMPVLARLVDDYQGKFLLAKLNTEEQQAIAARFGIRSIPTVKLFRDGQVVDEFMGALPEAAVREFLDRHIEREPDPRLDEARERLDAGDIAGAESILDSLPEAEQDSADVAALRNRLHFASHVADAPDAAELEARLASDAGDAEALLQLALRKTVSEDYDGAVQLLLELMQTDRSFGDDAARKTLLKVFDLLGEDPRVNQYRRRMASLLY